MKGRKGKIAQKASQGKKSGLITTGSYLECLTFQSWLPIFVHVFVVVNVLPLPLLLVLLNPHRINSFILVAHALLTLLFLHGFRTIFSSVWAAILFPMVKKTSRRLHVIGSRTISLNPLQTPTDYSYSCCTRSSDSSFSSWLSYNLFFCLGGHFVSYGKKNL